MYDVLIHVEKNLIYARIHVYIFIRTRGTATKKNPTLLPLKRNCMVSGPNNCRITNSSYLCTQGSKHLTKRNFIDIGTPITPIIGTDFVDMGTPITPIIDTDFIDIGTPKQSSKSLPEAAYDVKTSYAVWSVVR